MTLHRLTPSNDQLESASDLYTLVTARGPGDPVDCASCATRHERDALTWFQLSVERRQWLMAAICEACAALDLENVEQNIYRHHPPVREAAGWREGAIERTFLVCDPDFNQDRRS